MFTRNIAIYCASLALAIATATSAAPASSEMAAPASAEMARPCQKYQGSTNMPFRPLSKGTGLTKDVYSAPGRQMYAWYLQNKVYFKADGDDSALAVFAFSVNHPNAAPQVSYYQVYGDGDCIAPLPASAASNGATYSVAAFTQTD